MTISSLDSHNIAGVGLQCEEGIASALLKRRRRGSGRGRKLHSVAVGLKQVEIVRDFP